MKKTIILATLTLIVFINYLLLCSSYASEVSEISKSQSNIETIKDKQKKIAVNFVDVDIATVVKFISDVTGKNFVFDDQLKGNITIIAPSKLTVDEAFSLFTSALELKGFTVIPTGKVYKIVPITQAKQSGAEILKGEEISSSDAFITKLIQLRSISSTKAMNFLQPLVSKDGHISSYGPGNMLMIVDSANNIDKIIKIIEIIDKPGIEEPELVILKYANAEEVAKILSEALTIGSSKTQPAQTRIPRPGETIGAVSIEETRASVFADTRLNALILIGDKQEREAMKRMIALLDIPLPEATSKINVYFLEHADATELAKVLEGMITGVISQVRAGQAGQQATKGPFDMGGKITISPDKATNSLIIVSSPADYQNILQVIKQLDRKRKQVYVEAMIVEASIDKLQELGAKWRVIARSEGEPVALGGFGTINAEAVQNILYGLTGLTGGGMGNFMDIKVNTINEDGTISQTTLTVPGFAALFSLSEFKGAINVLSTPQILTSDNKEAEIVVGENVPFISKKESDPSRPQSIFSTIERKDVGITLRITPQITEGDYVKLDIYQEISALKQESTAVVLTVGPTTTKRSTKTSVVVKDKQTVVIGGLMEEREEENLTKVPILGDIPLLGWLFKSRSTEKKKTNLLVFLTPHIVKEAEQLSKITDNKSKDFARMENRYKEGVLLVKFKDGVEIKRIQEIISEQGAEIVTELKLKGLYHIKLKKGQSVEDAIKEFQKYDEVEYAEPDYIKRIQTLK